MAEMSSTRIKPFTKKTGFEFRVENNEMLKLEHSFLCAKDLALRKVDKTDYEGLEIWCWRRTQKIGWTDCAK
jgi:hypothetical protein